MLYEWYISSSFPLRLILAVVHFLKRMRRGKEFLHVARQFCDLFHSLLGITVWRIHERLLAGLSRGYPSHTVDAPWFRDCETACHLLGAVAQCALYSPCVPSTERIARIATDIGFIGIDWALAIVDVARIVGIIRTSRNVKLLYVSRWHRVLQARTDYAFANWWF